MLATEGFMSLNLEASGGGDTGRFGKQKGPALDAPA
jgi:hypothetical protein